MTEKLPDQKESEPPKKKIFHGARLKKEEKDEIEKVKAQP
jgi:hypothetical protein